jgi:hypothetical protein
MAAASAPANSGPRFHAGSLRPRPFVFNELVKCYGMLAASIRPMIVAMASDEVERLKTRVQARQPADATARITYSARANAIKGRVPK